MKLRIICVGPRLGRPLSLQHCREHLLRRSTLVFCATVHQRGGSPRHSKFESIKGTQLDPIAAAVTGGIILSWESCLDAA